VGDRPVLHIVAPSASRLWSVENTAAPPSGYLDLTGGETVSDGSHERR
jgi:hypothetical protein